MTTVAVSLAFSQLDIPCAPCNTSAGIPYAGSDGRRLTIIARQSETVSARPNREGYLCPAKVGLGVQGILGIDGCFHESTGGSTLAICRDLYADAESWPTRKR